MALDKTQITETRQRSLEEALSEVTRECNVRERCFPRWVAEGRMDKTDAVDRFDRLFAARRFLVQLQLEGMPDDPFSESPRGQKVNGKGV